MSNHLTLISHRGARARIGFERTYELIDPASMTLLVEIEMPEPEWVRALDFRLPTRFALVRDAEGQVFVRASIFDLLEDAEDVEADDGRA